MKLKKESYLQSLNRLPTSGQHILGCQDEENIVFYQAYKNSIADWAVKNQFLGGPDYSYNRMSWIKPNFLWMMYRSGWAEKENQNRVLAIWIKKVDFESILREAVLSSYNPKYYDNHEQWKNDINTNEVRLQWDPDHDPFGNKLIRRAIQLGLKGQALELFGKNQIILIEDITKFVKEQKQFLDNKQLDKLFVPVENIYKPSSDELCNRIGVE